MTNVNLEKLIAKAKFAREKRNNEESPTVKLTTEKSKAPHPNCTHGLSKTRLYRIFKKMKDRCYLPSTDSYKYYGARGIKICDEWLSDFTKFYNWALENGYADDLTIDRKNVDGNYEPSNCKWATPKEQGNNRRDCRYITINGRTRTFAEWCEYYDTPLSLAKRRLNFGWSDDLAVAIPSDYKGRNLFFGLDKN